MNSREQQIFKQASSTFFASSLLFPGKIRRDVFDLYSFLRVADDYVDSLPPDEHSFIQLKKMWQEIVALGDTYSTRKSAKDTQNKRVIKNIVRLCRKYNFEKQWVDLFLSSMTQDLERTKSIYDNKLDQYQLKGTQAKKVVSDDLTKKYRQPLDALSEQKLKTEPIKNQKQLLLYTHGSAEVVGLMMSRIMGLPSRVDEFAKAQVRALQMINFIRDIKEDNNLGRCYFVNSDFKKFRLVDLSEQTAKKNPEKFKNFIRYQIEQYNLVQSEAEKGYRYIPRKLLIPIKTAVDKYNWTAKEIAKDPFIVFDRKVKSKQINVLKSALHNFFTT